MSIHFLFPADPVRTRRVDAMFGDQADAARAAGFGVSTIADEVFRGEESLRADFAGALVIYRGWMVTPQEYGCLVDAIEQRGGRPITSRIEYETAHYLPNWYPLVSEFTPETFVFEPDEHLESRLRALGWDAYFIKDYVKSLKTARGAVIHDPRDVYELLDEMRQTLGVIEGGVCVRRVEPFVTGTERRYFVLRERPFDAAGEPIPELVTQAAQRVPCPFISVDVVRRADGEVRIVEVGDGQVSDLVGWTAARFMELWLEST